MVSSSATTEICAQEGPQTAFLSTSADIAVYGGAAGGGKSWALLIEPLRHMANSRFRGVIFRRTYPEISGEGGLWEKSGEVYPKIGAKPRLTDLKWTFPSKMTVRFAHMQHEDDKHSWQGQEIPYIAFDELTHFTDSQFFYLVSRNRSLCGVKPYMRGTCNPDALSWVKRWLAPWLDKTYPLKAESGEILWMVRDGNQIDWFRDKAEAIEAAKKLVEKLPVANLVAPEHFVKSVTFISASVFDNKILLQQNPEYLGNLMAMPLVERKRLLEGDWDIVPEAGKVFDRSWFEVIDKAPVGDDQHKHWDVRFWDFAASEKKTKGDDPDWTVGTKMRKHGGKYYVMDVVRFRATPGDLETRVKNVASQEPDVLIRWEEEGGSSGKIASHRLIEVLDGYDCRGIRPQGDKVTRAMPFAAQAEAQNVKVVRPTSRDRDGDWLERWFTEMHHFPDADHDDQPDSASGAYNYLKRFGADVTVGPDIWSN